MISVFGLHLSPVFTTYHCCDSGGLLNIKLQLPHLKMKTIIVHASLDYHKCDNHSERKINKACDLQEKGHLGLPKELRMIPKKS